MDIGSLPQMLVALFRNLGAEAQQAGKDQLATALLKPGVQYEGKVLEVLASGRHLVQVNNQAMDMSLPQPAKSGDLLKLTYLGASPRPTFVIAPDAPATARPVNLSQAAQQISALIRHVPVTPANAAGTTPASASGATPANAAGATAATPGAQTNAGVPAKPILANPHMLLAPVTGRGAPATVILGPAVPAMAMAGTAVEGAAASRTSTPSMTTQGAVAEKFTAAQVFPQRLQQTVKESGLFYESHLARWVKGEMPLESIQREPLARLSQSPGPVMHVPDLDGMPEEAARMASRQLNLLEGGPILWQGQAWPGQFIEWQVSDGQGQGDGGEDYEHKWASQLRLTLPRLGDVSADLNIGADGLHIRLATAAPETLAEVQAALPDLAERMRAAGLNLTRLQASLIEEGKDERGMSEG